MTFKFLALGLGQCSSALAVLIANKDPRVKEYHDLKYCIFADTQGENYATYAWMGFLREYIERREMFLVVITKGNLFEKCINPHPPLCTKDYKILPTRRFLRSLGVKKAIKLLGITYEERERKKENNIKWIENHYPLVDLKLKRSSCINIIRKAGLPIPIRSGCWFCKHKNKKDRLLLKRINGNLLTVKEFF